MSLKSAPAHLYFVTIEQAKKLGDSYSVPLWTLFMSFILYVEILGWVTDLVIASMLVLVTPTLRMMNVQYEFEGNMISRIYLLSLSQKLAVVLMCSL
jgi:hypothetical protein